MRPDALPAYSSSAAAIIAAKAGLRCEAQERRKAAWEAWIARGTSAAGDALAAHVEAVLDAASATHAPSTASAYWPMRTEMDPLPLLAALASAGLATALPVVAGKARPLVFRRWSPGDETVAAGFGTREPAPANDAIEPDLLLVPLLAFDRAGYRLGYGGGFYDRTLRHLRAADAHGRLRAVSAIGLAFDEQLVDAVPHLDYDERLDGVLTPSGLVLFAG